MMILLEYDRHIQNKKNNIEPERESDARQTRTNTKEKVVNNTRQERCNTGLKEMFDATIMWSKPLDHLLFLFIGNAACLIVPL